MTPLQWFILFWGVCFLAWVIEFWIKWERKDGRRSKVRFERREPIITETIDG